MKLTRRNFCELAGSAVAVQTLPGSWRAFGQPTSDDLTAKSLTEVSTMIHSKTVTSKQLVSALLDRIGTYNPKVSCFITVMGREALAQPDELDAEAKAGRFRGPLHGIPIGLKDNIDTAGTRTTTASPMFKDRVPTEDADIVRRLKAADAAVFGKLNLQEFALACTRGVSYFGPSCNPWNLSYVTGGSSVGSGAALASNLVFGALGADTGGSIRVPSAWCGTVGLMPTFGLVSIRGIIPCTADLDHCGPMARTVEDVALMLGQMTGYDNLDIFSVPTTPEDYVKSMKQPVNGFRLGTPQSFYDHLEPEIDAAVKIALDVLAKLTAGVTSSAPLWEGLPGSGTGDADFYHHDLIEKYGLNYMPPTRVRFERMENPQPGMKIPTASDVARARQMLMTTRRTIDSSFKDFDLVVVPTTRQSPPKINDSLARELAGGCMPGGGGAKPTKVYDFFQGGAGCSNTAPFDAFGVPAISLPCGYTKDGLPIGLMISGPHFSEGKVLALAYACQQARTGIRGDRSSVRKRPFRLSLKASHRQTPRLPFPTSGCLC
jgi:aspartyl-tRNA(Asn)/glutamyl-tRNA(Gln) amidotransferase subunit A